MPRKDITANKLRQDLRALIHTGEIRQSEYAQKWAENPVGLIEDFNIKITEKVEELILSVIDPKIGTLLVAGPRGGGKTLVISVTIGGMFIFNEYDVLHMGGSETQAKYGFGYLTNYYFSDSAFSSDLGSALTMNAYGPRKNWYRIGACSETFVRGFHPGDPHREMGNREHGGILFVDEEAVAKEKVVKAAIPTVGDANPSKTIRASTNHEETNGFARALEDPAGHGVDKVIEFDSFDVSEKCKFSCYVCQPEFAGPLNKKEYPRMLADRGKDRPGADRPKGYCEGKAKTHRPGHKRIKRLRVEYKQLGPQGFEQEHTRNKNKSTGNILPRAWLDKCLSGNNQLIEPMPGRPTAFMADHAPNFTAYVILQIQNDWRIAVLDVEHLIRERSDQVITDTAVNMIKRNGATFGFGDAAQGWMLTRIAREAGIQITHFNFNERSKQDSIGHTRRLFEDIRLLIPGKRKGKNYYFPKPSFRTFFEHCAGWHRDKNGKVVKKDDHYPDAVCTGAEYFITGNITDIAITRSNMLQNDSHRGFYGGNQGTGKSLPPGFYDQ